MSEYILQGNETPSNLIKRTQVWEATHNKGDESRLPLMQRSFISFTYGGKHIEDFGLIAITENNSMDRKVYSEFNDLTTDSDVIDGQFYWNSHYKANALNLKLFTDEITEKQLATFSQWFKPGFARELILAEHPNRGIMARIAEVPEYHMLPFEKKIKSKIYGIETSTTSYRGSIDIRFIMDDPHWYSITNLLEGTLGNWNSTIITNDRDALKVIEEDGIPTAASLKGDLLIGTNVFVSVISNPARTWRDGDPDSYDVNYKEIFVDYAIIGGESDISINNDGFSLAENTDKYFYYAGTAPCAPILKFTINFATNGSSLCSTINNTYTNVSHPYNSIYIESVTEPRELRITTPGLITAYNQAISLGGSASAETKRDNINHYKVRAASINGGLSSLFDSTTQADFTINCETGEALVTYHLRTGNLTENTGDMIRSNYLKIEDRNYPDENGYIHSWTSSNPEFSHKLYHDITSGLSGVKLEYKYKYL